MKVGIRNSLVCVSLAIVSHQALPVDQRLLTEHLAKVGLTFRVDGPAVRAKIRNGSPIAVTSGKLVCAAYDMSVQRRQAPDGRVVCDDIADPRQRLAAIDERVLRASSGCLLERELISANRFEQTVLPGKEEELYFEFGVIYPIVSCRLDELRGREKKLWEF